MRDIIYYGHLSGGGPPYQKIFLGGGVPLYKNYFFGGPTYIQKKIFFFLGGG